MAEAETRRSRGMAHLVMLAPQPAHFIKDHLGPAFRAAGTCVR
jgi:hypothetical protein